MRYTPAIMIFRAVFSGLVIVFAVLITKGGGPIIGGMFVMFPAMFVGMIFMTYFSQGATFSAAVMKSSILRNKRIMNNGSIPIFLGFIGGTVISIIVSFAGTYVIRGYLMRRTS